ncbi:MAG: hypothetical protein D6819_08245, partial [Gammaproteobacteria bacterium]
TRSYQVDIQLFKNGVIKEMSCTCPYEWGPVCKHEVAALLALRDTLQKHPQLQSRQQSLEEALAQLPPQRLRKLLLELALRDDRAYQWLEAKLGTPAADLYSALDRYRRRFGDIRSHWAEHGYIDAWDAASYAGEALDLLEAAQEVGPVDAVGAALAFFEVLAEDAEFIDDSNGEVGNAEQQACTLIEDHFFRLPVKARQEAFSMLKKLAGDKSLSDYGFDLISQVPITLAEQDETLRDAVLEALEQRYRKARSDHDRQILLEDRVALLERWGHEDEAEALRRQHMEVPSFRRHYVEEALARGDDTTARRLLEEGIRIAQAKKHEGVVKQWQEMLLDILERNGDMENARRTALDLFMARPWHRDDYQRLKALHDPEVWKRLWPELIKLPNLCDDIRADILCIEGDAEGLLEIVKRHAHDEPFVRQWAPRVADRDPEAIVAIYTALIREISEEAHRSAYDKLTDMLKELAALPEGKAQAQALIAELRERYPRRRLLMERLDGLALEG